MATVLSNELKAQIEPMGVCAINHSLSYCVLQDSAHMLAATLEQQLAEANYKIRAHCVRVRPEQSPERQELRRCFYKKSDYLQGWLPNEKWDKSPRGMCIYSLPGYELVGALRSSPARPPWQWHDQGCRLLGLDARGVRAGGEERVAKRHAPVAEAAGRMEDS